MTARRRSTCFTSYKKARIKSRFNQLALELKRKARWCHHYFFNREALPIESWAHYAFLEEGLSTYEHKTSIVVESIRYQEKSILKINLMRQLTINLNHPSSKPGKTFLGGAYRIIVMAFLMPSLMCSHGQETGFCGFRWSLEKSLQYQVVFRKIVAVSGGVGLI